MKIKGFLQIFAKNKYYQKSLSTGLLTNLSWFLDYCIFRLAKIQEVPSVQGQIFSTKVL